MSNSTQNDWETATPQGERDYKFFGEMKTQLILGDCLEKMKDIPANSVDSVVTDPPYELGFMGKSWDNTGIANNKNMWAECLRVLKPGGHLLAFGGTRTYHRMACAIEDAGFEVRDMIEWVYGSGFPKSLNIGKAVDKLQGNERKVTGSYKVPDIKGDAYGTMNEKQGGSYKNIEVNKTKGTSEWEGWGTALKPAHEPICMARKPLAEYPPVLDVCCGPRMMWFDKTDARAIYQDKRDVEIKTNPNKAYKNGKTFVIRPDIKGDFSSMDFPNNTFKHVVFDPPHFLETDPKSKMLMRVQYGQLESNWKEIIRKGFSECFRVLQNGGTLVFKWCEYDVPVSEILELTSVKPLYGHRSGKQSKTHWLVFIKTEEQAQNTTPAHEPICMARKPLAEKSVALNVLKYGTGGINIDESRVDTNGEEVVRNFNDFSNQHGNKFGNGEPIKTERSEKTTDGRWPANLIHDNSEEVRECFPNENERFFESIIYTAKASKSERNKGCEELEDKDYKRGIDTEGRVPNDLMDRFKTLPAKNNHPTVKPIALMEYLVKLVSREGHVVLDPFMGSGSTGIACKNLNRNFIGIELDPDYIKIAQARINSSPLPLL